MDITQQPDFTELQRILSNFNRKSTVKQDLDLAIKKIDKSIADNNNKPSPVFNLLIKSGWWARWSECTQISPNTLPTLLNETCINIITDENVAVNRKEDWDIAIKHLSDKGLNWSDLNTKACKKINWINYFENDQIRDLIAISNDFSVIDWVRGVTDNSDLSVEFDFIKILEKNSTLDKSATGLKIEEWMPEQSSNAHSTDADEKFISASPKEKINKSETTNPINLILIVISSILVLIVAILSLLVFKPDLFKQGSNDIQPTPQQPLSSSNSDQSQTTTVNINPEPNLSIQREKLFTYTLNEFITVVNESITSIDNSNIEKLLSNIKGQDDVSFKNIVAFSLLMEVQRIKNDELRSELQSDISDKSFMLNNPERFSLYMINKLRNTKQATDLRDKDLRHFILGEKLNSQKYLEYKDNPESIYISSVITSLKQLSDDIMSITSTNHKRDLLEAPPKD